MLYWICETSGDGGLWHLPHTYLFIMHPKPVLYLLSHTSRPVLSWEFPLWCILNFLARLPSIHDCPELCLLSSSGYRPGQPLPFCLVLRQDLAVYQKAHYVAQVPETGTPPKSAT
jgi:hypothetical protein